MYHQPATSIQAKQVQRAIRAIEERRHYHCRPVIIGGSQCCYVLKLGTDGKPVECYTVRFRKAGVPVCSCEDSRRHRGLNLCCKHGLMALDCLAKQELAEAETARRRAETVAEFNARVEREKELWS